MTDKNSQDRRRRAILDAPSRLASEHRNKPIGEPDFDLPRGNRDLGLRGDFNYRAFVADNLWETRTERGIKYRVDVLKYIEETYKDWLPKGMVQADLTLDPKLYVRFHQRLAAMSKDEKERTLLELNLPTQADANLAKITDPEKREKKLTARALAAKGMRLNREAS